MRRGVQATRSARWRRHFFGRPRLDLVALILLALAARGAEAGGSWDTFAVDARSLGLGGARTATGGGAAAAHYNPAALSFTNRATLSASFSLTEPMVQINTPGLLDESLRPVYPTSYGGWTVGFVFPFTGFLEDWLTFGLVFRFPATVLARLRGHDPAQPFLYMYDTATDHYESAMGLSLSPFEWFSIGAGLRYSAGQRGVLNVSLDPLRQRVTEQSIDAWQYSVVVPTFGATAGPIGFDWLTVQAGASWWEPLVTPMQLPAVIELDGLEGGFFIPVSGNANFTPRTLSVGVAASSHLGGIAPELKPLGTFLATIEASYQFWSEAPSPYTGVAVSSYGADLDLLGIGDVIAIPAPGEDRDTPPGFVDTARVRVGVEWSEILNLLSLRFGYGYRASPVPDQTSGTNLVDTATHSFSTGAGLRFGIPPLLDGTIVLDGGLQTQVLVPRSVVKVNSDDPVGDWNVGGFVHVGMLMIAYEF